MSYYFLALNRNKKSLAIDLKKKEGKDIFLGLVKQSDVLIENFRPGVMDGLGLSYDNLRTINPSLIYCSLSGFGQDSPFRSRPAHDINFLAETGYLDLNLKCGNRLPPLFLADFAGAMFTSLNVALALLERGETGQGRYIDVSLFDSFFACMTLLISKLFVLDRPLGANDSEYVGNSLCYNIYPTSDNKLVAIGLVEPKFWAALCNSLEHPELIDKQFCKRSEEPAAFRILEDVFASRTSEDWLKWSETVDTCLSVVQPLEDVLAGDQVKARQLAYMLNVPAVGNAVQVALPIALASREPPAAPPPRLGAHTEEILLRLGLSADTIEALQAEKVVLKAGD